MLHFKMYKLLLVISFFLLFSIGCKPLAIPANENTFSPLQTSITEQSENSLDDIIEPLVSLKEVPELIGLCGEQISIDKADYIEYNNITSNPQYVEFNNFGYVAINAKEMLFDSISSPQMFDFENENFTLDYSKDYLSYEKLEAGSKIGGITVDTAQVAYRLSKVIEQDEKEWNYRWDIEHIDIIFTGTIEAYGYLTKSQGGEFVLLAPGTLSFSMIESMEGFFPVLYKNRDYYIDWLDEYAEARPAPGFTLSGYNPEEDYPNLFSESDTVYIKAIFNSMRLLYSEKMTGMNYATLINIETLDSSE